MDRREHIEVRAESLTWEPLVEGTGRPVPTAASVSNRRALLEAELARYLPLLAGPGEAERVILFGSFARGEDAAESDLDIVVVKRTSLPFWRRVAEIRRLLKPRIATDVIVYTPEEVEQLAIERPFVRDEILGRGRVIYERH
jgi:predicted nucleotidyltransferase